MIGSLLARDCDLHGTGWTLPGVFSVSLRCSVLAETATNPKPSQQEPP